jgi:hypothetical protein
MRSERLTPLAAPKLDILPDSTAVYVFIYYQSSTILYIWQFIHKSTDPKWYWDTGWKL